MGNVAPWSDLILAGEPRSSLPAWYRSLLQLVARLDTQNQEDEVSDSYRGPRRAIIPALTKKRLCFNRSVLSRNSFELKKLVILTAEEISLCYSWRIRCFKSSGGAS